MILIKEKIQTMVGLVAEMEAAFPGRSFTLDGHLIGSIGEVMAAYYYGVELYRTSTKKHDDVVNCREVQIKITQQDNITISEEPDYLLVLYLTKKGDIYKVCNGRGRQPWDTEGKDSRNSRHMRVNTLIELDTMIPNEDRIIALRPIKKKNCNCSGLERY